MGKEENDYFRELGVSGRTLFPSVPIGISSLPDQTVFLTLRRGFFLNIMCIGVSGVGKTTLLNTLFRVDLKDEENSGILENVNLGIKERDLKEGNVNLKVKFIESRGFGDQIDQTQSFKNITNYIDEQFDLYLREESKVHRDMEKFVDPLVHACIYVIEPIGKSLSNLDIVTLKELQSRVNIVLVIGKADSLTVSELCLYKKQILEDLKKHSIEIYLCPVEDISISAKNTEFNERIPFAVISSCDEEMLNNQLCRIRKYPWGIVNVDDETHCEFSMLREMLLRINLYDMIKKTYKKFYLDYRYNRLIQSGPIIDAEILNSVHSECEKIIRSADEEIEKQRQEYEVKVRKLFETYRQKEHEAETQFSLRKNEFEHKIESLKGSSISNDSIRPEKSADAEILTTNRVDILKNITKIIISVPPIPTRRIKAYLQPLLRI